MILDDEISKKDRNLCSVFAKMAELLITNRLGHTTIQTSQRRET